MRWETADDLKDILDEVEALRADICTALDVARNESLIGTPREAKAVIYADPVRTAFYRTVSGSIGRALGVHSVEIRENSLPQTDTIMIDIVPVKQPYSDT